MPKELTEEAIRNLFLKRIARYIEEEKDSDQTTEEKLYSLAFSILAMIDGWSGTIENGIVMSIPQFILAPAPHPEDGDFNRTRGVDYYPENNLSEIRWNISWELHDHFSTFMDSQNW